MYLHLRYVSALLWFEARHVKCCLGLGQPSAQLAFVMQIHKPREVVFGFGPLVSPAYRCLHLRLASCPYLLSRSRRLGFDFRFPFSTCFAFRAISVTKIIYYITATEFHYNNFTLLRKAVTVILIQCSRSDYGLEFCLECLRTKSCRLMCPWRSYSSSSSALSSDT